MTQDKEKITPQKNVEEQERLKAKYEAENEQQQQIILELENKITKKDDEIFELQKGNKNLATERDDWKKEAHAQRKVHQESKQVKETNDFLTELKKLQEKKGLQWDEQTNQWINK